MVRVIAKMRRILLAAAACVSLAGCGPAPADQVSTTFDGNKQLVVEAGYAFNSQNTYVSAWADEPPGTKATIEVNGPLHVHCDGTFQAYPPGQAPLDPRPFLDVGGGTSGLDYHAPPGSYSATVSIPSAGVQLKRSFQGDGGGPDYYTKAYRLPTGCLPIADTRQQLVDYISLYVHAADFYIGYLDDPGIKSRLLPRVAAANAALQAADMASVLQEMFIIRDTLQPVMDRTYNYDAYWFAVDSIALLSQAVPAD
jgi:hypothetical protein